MSSNSQDVGPITNAIEAYKASVGGDGLRIREQLPQVIERGVDSLTSAEKELLKWVGVFFRKPTPGKFMMRVRMPNGFATSAQLRTLAELSRRLGDNVVDITTRQQMELRGFTLQSVPEIWEKLRGVDLRRAPPSGSRGVARIWATSYFPRPQQRVWRLGAHRPVLRRRLSSADVFPGGTH